MATFYQDLEMGFDGMGGDSFAPEVAGTCNVISGTSTVKVVPNGLVSYYKLDEGTGGNAAPTADSVGGRTGTLSNATWSWSNSVPAAISFSDPYCLVFPGNGNVQLFGSNTYSITANVTYACWVKTTRTNIQYVIVMSNGAYGNSPNVGIVIGAGAGETDANDGKPAGAYRNAGGIYSLCKSAVSIADGLWHHVAFVVNGVTAALYVDGLSVATVSDVSTNNTLGLAAGTLAMLGSRSSGSSTYYYNGSLDDVRIYNRPLNASEVASLNAGNDDVAYTSLSTGCTNYWNLDEGTGTSLADSVGGITATARNTPIWSSGVPGQIRFSDPYCLLFNGSNQDINLGASNTFNFTATLGCSLSCWVKTNSLSHQRLINFQKGVATTALALGIGSVAGETDSVDGIPFLIYRDSANALQVCKGTTSIRDTGWHHVAATINGAIATLFVDGIQVATTSNVSTANTFAFTADNATLGSRSNGVASFVWGWMDDVRIFSRPITQAEVILLANGNSTFATSALTGKASRQISVSNTTSAGGTNYTISSVTDADTATVTAISGGTAVTGVTQRPFFVGGCWKTYATGPSAARLVAGDTTRIKATPYPVDTGLTATWRSGPRYAPSLGVCSNTTPVTITTTNNHGFTTGDYVEIYGAAQLSISGYWRITVTGAKTFTMDGSVGGPTGSISVTHLNYKTLTISSAVTASIFDGNTAWTGVATNVSSATTSVGHENMYGVAAAQAVIAAAYNPALPALVAYKTIPATDLSAYQQISFWMFTTSAIGNFSIRLCSDALGTTAVNTFVLPTIQANAWTVVTLDYGSSLGNSIQSVAIYKESGASGTANTISIDNLVACYAPSNPQAITLSSLIGTPDSTGAGGAESETWYAIQNIVGTRVQLLNWNGTTNGSASPGGRGWYGVSGTYNLWRRETYKPPLPAQASTAMLTIASLDSGTYLAPLTFTHGWNRTDMSTQDGENWFDGQNGLGQVVINNTLANNNYFIIDKIALVRADSINVSCYGKATVSVVASNNNSNGFSMTLSSTNCTFDVQFANNNQGYGGGPSNGQTNPNCTWNVNEANNNNNAGVYAAPMGIIQNCSINNNTNYGIVSAPLGIAKNCTTTSNGGNSVYTNSVTDAVYGHYFYSCVFNEAAFRNTPNTSRNAVVFSHNHNNTGEHRIDGEAYNIVTDSTWRHTLSGRSWKLSVTGTSRTADYPAKFKLATVFCEANRPVSVSAWMKRSSTYVFYNLVCPGGQITGIPNDIFSANLDPQVNLATYSQDLDQTPTPWQTWGSLTVTPNAAVDPNGNLTADLVSGLNPSTAGQIAQAMSGSYTNGVRYEPSFYIKKVSSSGTLRMSQYTSNTFGRWSINLSLLGSGWERITRSHPAVTISNEFVANNGYIGVAFDSAVSDNLSAYIWGMQQELGTTSSAYQASSPADNWVQKTITLTPAADGAVDIYMYAYTTGGNTTSSVWIDDMQISGAIPSTKLYTLDYAKDGQPFLPNISDTAMVLNWRKVR